MYPQSSGVAVLYKYGLLDLYLEGSPGHVGKQNICRESYEHVLFCGAVRTATTLCVGA